jgi:hypothetical protein
MLLSPPHRDSSPKSMSSAAAVSPLEPLSSPSIPLRQTSSSATSISVPSTHDTLSSIAAIAREESSTSSPSASTSDPSLPDSQPASSLHRLSAQSGQPRPSAQGIVAGSSLSKPLTLFELHKIRRAQVSQQDVPSVSKPPSQDRGTPSTDTVILSGAKEANSIAVECPILNENTKQVRAETENDTDGLYVSWEEHRRISGSMESQTTPHTTSVAAEGVVPSCGTQHNQGNERADSPMLVDSLTPEPHRASNSPLLPMVTHATPLVHTMVDNSSNPRPSYQALHLEDAPLPKDRCQQLELKAMDWLRRYVPLWPVSRSL